MKLIPLWGHSKIKNEKGRAAKVIHEYALVDNDDFVELNKIRWNLDSSGYVVYVGRTRMHRKIMGCIKGDGLEIDHINGNKLDNQRSNLRFATRSQNCANRNSCKGSSSKYKGVFWEKTTGKWKAALGYGGRLHHLGRYSTEIEAAIAHDVKASEVFGEFALLNDIPNLVELLPQFQANELLRVKKEVTSIKSGYKGVSWSVSAGKWVAQVGFNNKKYHIGRFKNEVDAAKAYNAKILELNLDPSRLNVLPDTPPNNPIIDPTSDSNRIAFFNAQI